MILLAAVGIDGAIGRPDGGLPWHLSDDLKRFKQMTMDKTLLMGYKTVIGSFYSEEVPLSIETRMGAS